MVFIPPLVLPSNNSNEVFPKFNVWAEANPELALELKNITIEFLVNARAKPLDEKEKISCKKIDNPNTSSAVIAIIITLVVGIIFVSGFLLGHFL